MRQVSHRLCYGHVIHHKLETISLLMAQGPFRQAAGKPLCRLAAVAGVTFIENNS
jgi:hypothetical protein